MSNIKDYWTLDMASDSYGISRNSLDKWRKDAVEAGRSELSEPDAVYGNTQLFHKSKWHKVLEFHYADQILHLSKLGLIFTPENVERGMSEAYERGFDDGQAHEFDEQRRKAFARVDLPEAIEPLEETNEPLVAYATTKGPDFGKLTDGHGFQPIV